MPSVGVNPCSFSRIPHVGTPSHPAFYTSPIFSCRAPSFNRISSSSSVNSATLWEKTNEQWLAKPRFWRVKVIKLKTEVMTWQVSEEVVLEGINSLEKYWIRRQCIPVPIVRAVRVNAEKTTKDSEIMRKTVKKTEIQQNTAKDRQNM